MMFVFSKVPDRLIPAICVVTSPNKLTKPGFPDLTEIDDEIVWKNGTVLVTGDSILSGLSKIKMSKQRLIKVCYFPGARIRDTFFYLVSLLHEKPEFY